MNGEKKVTRKSKFTQSEDLKLWELVKIYGDSDWFSIANRMKNRNVRQCRERWCNYLSPFVSNGPWSPEEDRFLCQKVEEFGTKWTKIAPFFKARTDINVKNRWMTLMRHKNKQETENQKEEEDQPKEMAVPLATLNKGDVASSSPFVETDDGDLWSQDLCECVDSGFPGDAPWDYFRTV